MYYWICGRITVVVSSKRKQTEMDKIVQIGLAAKSGQHTVVGRLL